MFFVKTANDSFYQIAAFYSATVVISRGNEWSGTVNEMLTFQYTASAEVYNSIVNMCLYR